MLWVGFGAAVLLGGAVLADRYLDEPIRRQVEARLNAILQGYSVSIGAADFHVFNGSLDLMNGVVRQQAHPDPPVLFVPKLTASVQWKALLLGRVVADFEMWQPALHVDLVQLSEENHDAIPVQERGWQHTLRAIYPLRVNEFRIHDAKLVYIHDPAYRPLHMRQIEFLAQNIRNVASKDREYPSNVHLDGIVFDSGRIALDGNADFLAEPWAGVKANLSLGDVDLSYFEPMARHHNLQVTRGMLSARGLVEYAPHVKTLDLEELTIAGALADYVHSNETEAAERKTARQVVEAANRVQDKPGVLLRVNRLIVRDSTIGWVNQSARPPYRAFVSGLQLRAENFSNQIEHGQARIDLEGQFMGSGEAVAKASFRPMKDRTDFDMDIRIRGVKLPSMNDMLRAYMNVDVAQGSFSFFSEISVENGQIEGYVKPFFVDIKVYDPAQDKDKGPMRKLWEKIVGVLARLLENKQDEVATESVIAGPVENPRTSTLQIIGGLVQNAFFQAILPGLEGHAGLPGPGDVQGRRRRKLEDRARRDAAQAEKSRKG